MLFGFASLLATSLLWSCCFGVASPQPPYGHQISPRMVESPQKCSMDDDCGDAELLTCDLELKVCKCREKYSILSSAGSCLPARQLGEECVEHAQCRVFEKNASCEENSCVCDSGFYLLHDNNGSLCNPGKSAGGSGDYSTVTSGVDKNMIIVLAVLSIMFVGICVALHLFSKARFRNRRTIFNSPHPRLMHIKLGKRKKSSVRTQHLPPPPGQFIPRHHSFSGHHSPYPVPRVSKTRSHECLRSALSRESSPKFERRPKTAPLAERESLPSSEDLDKKTPEPLQNGGLPSRLSEEESQPQAPGSPTVIITDADGAHTVVTSRATSPGSAVNV
ncbi:uncharacterized protein LOC129968966 [Argiope bruennichi]|uniref:EB domain-containing protein n=1 Tax=Argiope bruennichi TaxID=94029 RepID=A0A8T0DZR8_ARGBR|nr:uncharacterized protein LOC129968966 [Argiope bruennichi]KAF8764038.1 hypothetical protein HNY73_022159 [Argiope bruennichi]